MNRQAARAALGGAFVPGRGCRERFCSRPAIGVGAAERRWSFIEFIELVPGFGYSSGRAPRELPCCFENWVSKYSLRSW